MDITEKQVQELIADFPWLLNINFERVPEFRNKGMEYYIGQNKRIDLILKDKITNRPVIIEFKAVPFYRENIGQILEYRARLIPELNEKESELYEIFGNLLSSPILILIVPICDDDARIACNLSGIEIYEYEKSIKKIIKPEQRKTLEELTLSINNSILPATFDRDLHIKQIDKEIKELLIEMGLGEGFKNHKYSPGIYYWSLNNFFINKWLFSDNEVSIGIVEDIFTDTFDKITIDFFSKTEESLNKFREEFFNLDKEPIPPIIFFEEDMEYYIKYYIDKEAFLNNTKKLLKPIIQKYIKTMRKLQMEIE